MDNLPPLLVHVIYRFGVGGLENGLVNLINHLPEHRYRHAVVCLTDSNKAFSDRIRRKNVSIYELRKREGQDWQALIKFYRLVKQLKPAIVHTRNLAAIEYQFPALLAGVKYRVHSEHGWDVFDPDGSNKKYRWLRRLMGSMIHRFIPLSRHLEHYLAEKAGIPRRKITRICNGVDTSVFYPRKEPQRALHGCPILLDNKILIGTVGRMHGVKDQLTLVKAFVKTCEMQPPLKEKTALILVGDGPLRQEAINLLQQHGLTEQAWLPGERHDVADILRQLDVFVLPSQAEGISNTILEAMATGLPVIATNVGGNAELVEEGVTGHLVTREDYTAMANLIRDYALDESQRKELGQNGYRRVLQEFSIDVMVGRYQHAYDAFIYQ
jgi:sugar transferase (PEP-CTERM/EpsH1 system associated)